MAVPRWFYSLQFRLVLGFAATLALALAGVSAYVSHAAKQETERFREQSDRARLARVESLLSRQYAMRRDWADVERTLEYVSRLYGVRVVLRNAEGVVVAESHPDPSPGAHHHREHMRPVPLRAAGRQIGTALLEPRQLPGSPPEPAVARLAAATNRALLFTGLGAGIGGILLVSLTSRRVLAPVRSLSVAARGIGQGDFSQRVPVTGGRDEVSELGHTFNSMAEQLERAQAQRRQLMADVAHELRTPISNIQGYLEAIGDGLLDPDDRTVGTIHEQALHLGRLVEDLRVLALADAGALRLHPEQASLEDIATGSVEAARPRARSKGISFEWASTGDLPPMNVDKTRLSQVIGNLLDNAITHTPDGGRIMVSTSVASEEVTVAVSDSGDGIPAERLPHLFDRFYRVDSSRSRRTGGSGLGLAIARELTELHGGRIEVQSEPGKGATFTVHLPAR